MDWKRFYADELAGDAGRDAVRGALARHAGGDQTVLRASRARGIVSVPHVTLRDSADPIARVATSIVASGATRVVALGVLHGGTLPEPHRTDLAELSRGGSPRAQALFARLGGAFTSDGAPLGAWVRPDAALLANEFSLDLFGAVLAAAAAARGVAAPPVTRVFVGPTRDPRGGFGTAKDVADALRPLLDEATVCVATGDLVHFGTGYTTPAETAAAPEDPDALRARFLGRIAAMHEAALARRDFAAAYAAGSELRSDQRNLLPVIAEVLGAPARADVLSFRLSDYAAINGVDPPCLVGCALVAFLRA